MDALGLLAVQGGPWVLLALLVVRGWLVPRSTHLREIGYMERTITALEATVAEQKKQIAALVAGLKAPPS